jgi:uncharacterized protein YigE (DUF2233 family)
MRRRTLWRAGLLCLLLAGCGRPADPARPALPLPLATLMPTATGQAPAGASADSGWLGAGPGVERRDLRVAAGASQAAPVSLVRLDPALVRFVVGYDPAAPRSIGQWAADSGALAAINGGFFDADNRTVSLLVRAGQPVGESYSGRGGMFAVAADGSVLLRGLADQPYDPAEPLAEALQGWPLLVRPGGTQAYDAEDGQRARRSALAVDRAGRVLLIACPGASFTLAELAAWLAGSDLAIDAAVNLDGGSSTGLILADQRVGERIDAFVPLPIALLALPR